MTTTAAIICGKISDAIEAVYGVGLRRETMPSQTAGTQAGGTFVIDSAPITTAKDSRGARVDGWFEADITILLSWPNLGGQHEANAVEVATAMEKITVAVLALEDTDGDLQSIELSGSANAGIRGSVSRSTMTFTIQYKYA